MTALKAKRNHSSRIKERGDQGLCIIDGCKRPMKQRGLCESHGNLFYGRLRALKSDEERIDFEDSCIREGLVLPNGEQRKLRRTDPFSKVG